MRPCSRVPLLVVLITVARAASAMAQDAYVFYDHRPGAANLDARLSYIRSGAESAQRQIGRPPRLAIPPGSQLCVQVLNRNAVLYAYSLTATKVAADTIPGLAALIKQLTDALQHRQAIAGHEPYLYAVANLFAGLQAMQAYQLASDTVVDFTLAAEEMAHRSRSATTLDSLATVALKALGPDTTLPEVILLRAVHVDLSKRVKKIGGSFRQALGTVHDPICTPVAASRLRVTVKIARTSVDTTAPPQRPVGDTVIAVDVDPRDDRTFLLEPGTLLSAFTQDKSTISLKNGVITQAPDHSPAFHAGVFALARPTSIRWLWATVGVATSDNAVSDVFIGITLRGGASLVGGRIALGAGLAMSRVPVGVSQGAVGGALPADVKNVDEIVQRGFRMGLGVNLAVQVP